MPGALLFIYLFHRRYFLPKIFMMHFKEKKKERKLALRAKQRRKEPSRTQTHKQTRTPREWETQTSPGMYANESVCSFNYAENT